MIQDVGFKLFVGNFVAVHITETMHHSTFTSNLDALFKKAKEDAMAGIKVHKQSCTELAWKGPLLAGEIDLTTAANVEYIIFMTSYISPGSDELKRVGLATRQFRGSHKAEDILHWMRKVTTAFFGGLIGDDVDPQEVFIGFTVDQGSNVFNAIDNLGIALIRQ